MTDQTYEIYGGLGSPYSMKMRAIFRYRHITHVWIQVGDTHQNLFKEVKAPVIPIIKYPDGSVHNDSTPMIFDLEERHQNGRSIVPENEAHAFLAYFLEDMADEWGTKMMFHYRWYRERDQKQMSEWLAYDRLRGQGRDTILSAASVFKDRQVGRMALVGCTEHNCGLIEKTAHMALDLLDSHVTDDLYLFGTRPSLADFSWYGQLSQLTVDPTPELMMRKDAPFAYRWIANLDDASGVVGQWNDVDKRLPRAVNGLLEMAGHVYLPFLVANAQAIEQGSETFHFSAYGLPYSQGAFKYQVKCLAELRSRMSNLSDDAKSYLEPILRDSGCWETLTAE